jgi:replicative DNA helicase
VEGNKTVLPDEDDSKAFVIIAKNRNGPLSDVEVMWDGQSMSFKPCIWKMESF